MHIVLLVTLVCSSLLLVEGEEDFFNDRPCQSSENQNAYKQFEKNHILPKNFKTNSLPEWEKHINNLKRCNELQTFIKEPDTNLVISICNGNGWNRQGDLCTSNSEIPVYVLKVKKRNCKVVKAPTERKQTVTVACDKIGNQCLPVHVDRESQTGKRPKITCSPAHWSDESFYGSVRIG